MPDLPFGVSSVSIPFEEVSIEGYLMFPADSEPPWPVVLLPAWYDNTAEDMYVYAAPALRRGYAALTFEGPGQGALLHEHAMFFRPDFEAVLTPVVDFVVEVPDLDPSRLILIGRSTASYLAARGATVEHRLAALVCDPGQPDMSARLQVAIPTEVLALIRTGDPRADQLLAPMLRSPAGRRLWLPRMAAHGKTTLHDYLHDLLSYTLLQRIGDIQCPTLVTESEGDPARGQSRVFFDRLQCPKEFRAFSTAEGVSGDIGGLGQQVWNGYVFDWLARTLPRPPGPR
jgi:dienelactone hydrolase